MKTRYFLLEKIFSTSALFCGLLTILIFLLMVVLGWPVFQEGRLLTILTEGWRPEDGIYGVYPMVCSTLSIAFLSIALSFPLSLGTSFLTTYLAPPTIRKLLLGLVRFMAGIPTVIYGFVAIFLLVPFMREYITGGSGMNILTASVVLSLLIAPTMIVFFVNGLTNVSSSYTAAVDALGGTPVQKLIYVVLPQAWPKIFAGLLLGLGRAMGDTLISLMVAGNAVATPGSITDSARTLTAHIALVIAADFSSLEFRSIFACGVFLYITTVLIVLLLRLCNTFTSKRVG